MGSSDNQVIRRKWWKEAVVYQVFLPYLGHLPHMSMHRAAGFHQTGTEPLLTLAGLPGFVSRHQRRRPG